MIGRLLALVLCVIGFTTAHASGDGAADYPNRTVRIVVPFPPGGPTDTFARVIADPAHTVAEFVALAKAKPGTLNFASSGAGSAGHLVAELFMARAGIHAVHVPYKGVAPTQTALMGGNVQFMFDSVGSSKPLVDAGKARGLAVTGKERSWAAPDTPTLLESGFPGFDAVIWHGILAPAGIPDPIAIKLEKALMQIARQPEVEARIKSYAAIRIGGTGAEFTAFIAREQQVWTDVITANNIRLGE